MAGTTPQRHSVHWAPSPSLSSPTLSSLSSVSSTSTLQYINAQLVSHGFVLTPGLCLDGLSSADAESVTKCLLSMLSQRVEDMTRAEDLTTKLRTLSYDHERLRTMHDSAKETVDLAEREATAARAKLTIANRAQQQAEGAHKQTMADLQRARSSLQALRATHVAELKKRDKDIEAMRERWSKLADSQLKIANLPSGMSVQPANALALGAEDGKAALLLAPGKGLADSALEEAEKTCKLLGDENGELKALVVDTTNAVSKILHKAISADPDNLEFPAPLATTDLFPLGAPDTAFERLSALLTSLRDALTTLRAASEVSTTTASSSDPKPHISLADLAKKVAESDAKAHKWEIEELRSTIAALRDELKKAKAERKPVAHASRVSMTFESMPVAHDNLVSHLPPTDESDTQHALVVGHSEPSSNQDGPSQSKVALPSTAPAPARAKPAPPPPPAPQPGPSRLSPRKTRSKSKAKLTHKSPSKSKRSTASASAKRLPSGSRPRRLTSKRVEASFETEVTPSTVPTLLLPTSFVLPPPSPESRLPPHPASLVMPSAPPLFFPSTTPPFPPPSSTAEGTPTLEEEIVLPVPTSSEPHQQSPPTPPPPRPFPLAKPLARNMTHAYSPAKPSPLSRILLLAASPESAAAAPPPRHQKNQNSHATFVPATAVFEPPPPPAPLPLRPGAANNAATTRRRAKKRTSGDAELDIDIDVNIDAAATTAQHPNFNSDPAAVTVAGDGGDVMEVEDVGGAGRAARDPRAPEKENTIRRRLKGPAAAAKTRKTVTKAAAAPHKSAPVPAESATVELGRVGGAASRLLLAAARGGGAAVGGTMANGPRRVPIDSAEAAAAAEEGVPAPARPIS